MAEIKLGILASGNGSNLQAILDATARGELKAQIALVLCNVPGARALERARQAGVRALCIPHREYATRETFDARLVAELKAAQVDWVVLAGFMRLLTPAFLRAYPERILNIHPSLLPAFAGTRAIERALEHGVKLTGCTVHLVEEGEVDAGPIVDQRAVAIEGHDTLESLEQRMHAAEHRLFVDVLKAVSAGHLRVERGAAGRRSRAQLVLE